MKTRRNFLKLSIGSLLFADTLSLFGAEKTLNTLQQHQSLRSTWKIGITDWDLPGHMGRVTSFALAKEWGFEGVQVSYIPWQGRPSDEDSLAVRANRPRFLEAAQASGQGIASLCIGMLNDRPLATAPEAEGWVINCLEAMDDMNIDQVLIPFFGNACMNRHPEHIPLVIEKFKRLAPIAERYNKILSIESTLTAEDHLPIIEAIGSSAIKVYYDTWNSALRGYDIYHEMELLGNKNLISQIHLKDGYGRYGETNGNRRLGEGEVNFARTFEILEKTGFEGWVVVETSVGRGEDRAESQMANLAFVRNLLGR